jgi:hypothetical protein
MGAPLRLRSPQLAICKAVEEADGGAKFHPDSWVREDGGGGISMVLKDGKVWEKAGCNLSVVYGSMPPEALQAATERGVDRAKGMKPGAYLLPRVRHGGACFATDGGSECQGSGCRSSLAASAR